MLADARLVYSVSVAEALRQRSAKPDEVFLALNAIDQSPIQAAKKWWLDRPAQLEQFRTHRRLHGTDLLVFLSRLRPAKNMDLLLDVMSGLVAEGRNVRLAIIGDGSERSRLEQKARELGISQHVEFLGAIYDEIDIAPWCLSATACVVPGSIGLSLLHVFGYGVPVATTDDEQTPEIEALRSGVNGIVVPPRDGTALLAELRSLLDDPSRRRRLSANAEATVGVGGFTLDKMVDGMVAAIRFAAGVRRRDD
jgi:glycosyltransferase involved in cell wall biosynthesis